MIKVFLIDLNGDYCLLEIKNFFNKRCVMFYGWVENVFINFIVYNLL